MKRLLLIITLFGFLSFFFNNLQAQDWDNYKPSKPGKTIPQEFLLTSTEKYIQQGGHLPENKKINIETSDRFLMESNFKIDRLLLSGKILFNEPMSDYLNLVADKVLENDQDLRKKLKFYVVKSPVPNAFATQAGIILVNIGLLARLENEAQLAYILCHEISHYTKNHVIKSYLQNQDLLNKKSDLYKEYKKSTDYEKLLVRSNYSKTHEIEADRLGFTRFAKTAYATTGIINVFNILKDAEEPYKQFDYSHDILNSSYIDRIDNFIETKKVWIGGEKLVAKFSGFKTGIQYFKDGEEIKDESDTESKNENTIEKKEKDEATLSTHPSPIQRQTAIKRLIAKTPNESKQVFLVSKKQFENISRIAKYELSDLYLKKKAYFDAYYNSLFLIKTYGASDFLKLNLVKSLYGITKYRNASVKYPIALDYKNLKDNAVEKIQTMHRIKLNLITLSSCFELYKQNRSNNYLSAICEDLIFDLKHVHEIDSTHLFTKNIVSVLNNLKEDTLFTQRYNSANDTYKKYLERESYFKSKEGKAELESWREDILNNGFKLGLNKVMIINPLFYSIDTRKKNIKKTHNPLQHIESEKQHFVMVEKLNSTGKELGLEIEMMNAKSLKGVQELKRMNDICLINSWFLEVLSHDNVDRFIPTDYNEVLQLCDEYNTNHFVNIGMFAVSPNSTSYTYSIVFNAKRNKPVMAGYEEKKGKITSDKIHEMMENQLKQMKRK